MTLHAQRAIFLGRLTLTPEHGPVGTRVEVVAKGLPAEATLDLVWESYDAEWNIEQREGVDWNQFRGIRLRPTQRTIQTVATDAQGHFCATLTVPEDYGGMHDVYLKSGDDALNKAGFRIDASASLSPERGPLGTPIAITLKGLNPAHPIEGWYQLMYDNALAGFVTALTTRGTAQVEVPATGAPGPHLIALEDASFGAPYLGLACSPYHYLKTFQLRFDLTPGAPVLPPPIGEQLQPEVPGRKPGGTGPRLWTDFFELPVGAAFCVLGAGLPPGKDVEVRWYDISGDRVSETQGGRFGTGFSELPRVLGCARVGANGQLKLRAVSESVQGGAHLIEAWCEGAPVARTYVRLSKRGHPLRPKGGSWGDPITVEVDGVSWTEHENLVAVTYDNALVGYACGNDLMGKVLAQLHASGGSGWHFIDVYPAFRTRRFSLGLEDEVMEVPDLYQKPILSWRDHPHGFHFRYAFRIEEGG